MTTKLQYSRMPGRSGLVVRDSLWMSADHLLSVRRNPFSESYRRFYFADIQAIVVTELPNLLAPTGLTAAVLFIVTAAALMYTWHPVWASLCALLSLVSFFVSWRSADCACYLQTSVSTEMLPSLRRRVDAAKATALLKAEIERTQGSVSAEVLEMGPPVARTARLATSKPALRHSSGQVHWIAFSLMLLRGSISAISLKGAASIPLGIAATIVGTAILLLLILAAIQQRNSDLPVGVRRLVYVTLSFYIASGLASFAVSIYIALQLGPRATSQAMIIENPMLKAYGLVDLLGFLALGCTGLILMWRHQHSVRTPPPLDLGNGG
jgi:hypothetical protein